MRPALRPHRPLRTSSRPPGPLPSPQDPELQDGSIERGGQNLPGNWESERFNLPQRLMEAIPCIGEHETVVLMHNDAVVHGLSQWPFMQDVEPWGVLTIGTGLGNARFTNRSEPE
jgi:hypothetical protein